MLARTIKKVLNKKHSDFVESIKDEEVRELVRKNSFITGGAIVSMLLDEEVNDYDYYFKDKETAFKVLEYYVKEYNKKNGTNAEALEVNGAIKVYISSQGVLGEPEGHELDIDNQEGLFKHGNNRIAEFTPVFLSSNAISLKGGVQLIFRFYGEPEVIHKSYDFIHAMSYWDPKTNELVMPAKTLEAILTKELVYTGSKFPLASILRAKKFINRGWTINAGQYLKMVLQLNEMDLLDVNVLKEQLTGVDVFYFTQVIEMVKNKVDEDNNFELTSTYLIEVIEQVFES